MTDPLMKTGTKTTPQMEKARPDQVENNAGGYVFTTSDDARLHRFLTLGTTGGTFYVKERPLTVENAEFITDYARQDSIALVHHAREISVAGRAPRNNPALYALAAASKLGDLEGRRQAFAALPDIARTGTHIFTFAGYRELFGGWGRGTRRAVGNWYLSKSPEDLAYQMVKYRQRDGWTHRDLLRLSHPSTDNQRYRDLFAWVCAHGMAAEVPAVIHAYQDAHSIGVLGGNNTQKTRSWVSIIGSMHGALPWEALPDEALVQPDVWRALIENGMPQGALLRKLPVLTRLGVLQPLSFHLRTVCDQLTDPARLIKARVHPVAVLVALCTYALGHSVRGDSTWTPVSQVTDALSDAFYASYGSVRPSGKRTMLCLDVSGSMGSPAGGLPISCREASAAVALVTAATEKDYAIAGFTSGNTRQRWDWKTPSALTLLNISPKQRLDDAIAAVSNLPFGATDCSLPMQWALETKSEVDTFVVATDSETWYGGIHPYQALREYRDKMGIDARLAVVAMTPTEFTIADPLDPRSMDVSGFDAKTPDMLADFSRGDI